MAALIFVTFLAQTGWANIVSMMVVGIGIPLIFNTDLSLVKPSTPPAGINEHDALLVTKKSPHREEQRGLSV